MSYVVTVYVTCDGDEDDVCEAEFETYLTGERLAVDGADMEQRVERQATSRGWVVTAPLGVRQRFVCPLHIEKGKRRLASRQEGGQ